MMCQALHCSADKLWILQEFRYDRVTKIYMENGNKSSIVVTHTSFAICSFSTYHLVVFLVVSHT